MIFSFLILIIRSKENTTIRRFSTHSIVEAPHMTQLVPECATQMEYFVTTNSKFCVLSNQSTIIGVSNAYPNMIIKHSITDLSEPVVTFNFITGRVYTLGVNEHQNVLFAGGSGCDSDGQVMQYDLSTGQVVKAIGKGGIGSVQSSISVGNLWFFGGYGSFKLVVVDSVSRQVLGKPVRSAIWTIYSIAVFKIQEMSHSSKVLILTVGLLPNYSKNQTDVFDITALVNKHSNLAIK